MSQWECFGIELVTFSRHLVYNSLANGKPWLKRWPIPYSKRKTGNTRHQHYYGKIVWQKRKIDLSFLMKGSVEKSKISFYSLLRHKFIAYIEEKTQTISRDSPWTAFNDQIMVSHDPWPYFTGRMTTFFVLQHRFTPRGKMAPAPPAPVGPPPIPRLPRQTAGPSHVMTSPSISWWAPMGNTSCKRRGRKEPAVQPGGEQHVRKKDRSTR